MGIESRKINTHSIAASDYEIREETLDGKVYLVVPVVMMVEGVHNGSDGPMFHSAEALSDLPVVWNGIPVMISHPEEGGQNISANAPHVLEQHSVGRVFNTHYDNGLKAEAWIDLEKIESISPEALASIRGGEPLEVSVGVFNDTEQAEEGAQWNGETYESIASNYKPDHLALLPGEKGACSWEDGCGIRTNKEGGVDMKELLTTFKELSQKGYVVSSLLSNAQGYRETMEALQGKVNALDTKDSYNYVEEVFDDHIIYRQRVYQNDNGGSAETLYRQEYTIDDNNGVVFSGFASEVKKKVEYVIMSKGMTRTKFSNNSKQGGDMSEKGTLCCEAKVDALIANKRTHWMASDREWLLTQGEAIIAKMSPMEPEKAVEDPTAIQANKAAVVDEFKGSLVTIEDYAAIMPDTMKARIEKWVAAEAAEREALVKSITDNSDKLKKEDLEVLSDDILKGIAESIKQPADYSAQGAGRKTGTAGEAPMIPIEFSRERKEV